MDGAANQRSQTSCGEPKSLGMVGSAGSDVTGVECVDGKHGMANLEP